MEDNKVLLLLLGIILLIIVALSVSGKFGIFKKNANIDLGSVINPEEKDAAVSNTDAKPDKIYNSGTKKISDEKVADSGSVENINNDLEKDSSNIQKSNLNNIPLKVGSATVTSGSASRIDIAS